MQAEEIAHLQKQTKTGELYDHSLNARANINRAQISTDPSDANNLTDTSLSSIFEHNESHRSDLSIKDQPTGRGLTAERFNKEQKDIPASQESKSKTPVRGVVVPLMRSNESPGNSIKQDSRSNSLKRSTNVSPSNPPTLDQMHQRPTIDTFLRNDYYRHSMPVRISTSSQHQRSSKGHPPKYWVIAGQKVLSPDVYPNRHSTAGRDTLSSTNREYASNRSHINSVSNDDSYRSPLDSSTVSEAASLNRDKQRSHHEHQGSSRRGPQWQYSSYSEKTVTETTENVLGDDKRRCRALVDQLVQLQAHSQQLRAENSELQLHVQAVQTVTQKLNDLEDRNLQLEAENKKLKTIIEAIQGTVPQSLYDKRTYQFNTIV